METILRLLIGVSLVLIGVQISHARGFGGGFHGGGFSAGGFHAGGFEAGGFHAGGFDAGGFHAGGFDAGAVHAGGFDAAGVHAGGLEAGGFHASGFEAGGVGHVGLPTDGAFGRGWTGAAYGAVGNRTVAWSGGVAAARGAAVRNSFGHYGVFGAGWYGAHPGAWAAAGWAAGAAWNAAAWPAVGAWCGWGASVQPFDYEYGNNITYQGDEVYYGAQPAATADEYYQQASTLAESARRRTPRAPTGCRWASSRSCRETRPTRPACSNWRSTSRGPSRATITAR